MTSDILQKRKQLRNQQSWIKYKIRLGKARARPWTFSCREPFNITWQAVFPCDTVKEIPAGRVHWKNQLVCLVVANAFKGRLILSATSVCWQQFFHHSHNPPQKTLLFIIFQETLPFVSKIHAIFAIN